MTIKNDTSKQRNPSLIDPMYRDGNFIKKSTGYQDAAYKVNQLRILLQNNQTYLPEKIRFVADIGCGSGNTTYLIRDMLVDFGYLDVHLHGYDIHPYVSEIPMREGVDFIAGDFCIKAQLEYDMAILFDVIEHIPDPIEFLRSVKQLARILVLHIPLDDSLMIWIRNLPRNNLNHPGHLLSLNPPSALNLLSFSGLRVVDYAFSPAFRAPSGKLTRQQQIINPIRELTYRLNPYLTQMILGGVSLLVLAKSPITYAVEKHGNP